MTIHGGTSANYYRCVDQKKRGTCSNKLSLREDVAKRRLLDTIEERYARPKAILHLRQLIAERLGELSRKGNAQLEERRERLKRTRDKVAALVHFITMGDQSDAVRKSLYDFEAQAKAEEAAIAGLLAQASKPIPLPSPEFALRKVVDFRKQVEEDPVQARENMRRFFEQGRLLLMPQPEGHYIAATNFSPLRSLDFRETPVRSPGLQSNLDHKPKGLWSRESCAGRI